MIQFGVREGLDYTQARYVMERFGKWKALGMTRQCVCFNDEATYRKRNEEKGGSGG